MNTCHKSPYVIALAGGIGVGKSVVSRMLRNMGYCVYDSDSAAKSIMDNSPVVKDFLVKKIHPQSVDAIGKINREIVASVVFSDEYRLKLLNGAVHKAVREDFRKWSNMRHDQNTLFIECAVLCESGLDGEVDAVWGVVAPEQLRVKRVCRRNSLAPAQVLARIKAQRDEADALGRIDRSIVINDGMRPLLPQIESLLGLIS